MFSSLLALSFYAMAAPAGPAAGPRKAYAACLKKVTNEALDKKMDAADFGRSLDAACPAEAAALRNAIVAQRIAAGARPADAQAIARDDVLDFQLNAAEMYAEYLESGAKPN